MEFRRIGVIGSGLMGSGIAQVAATSGCDVVLVDIDRPRVEAGIAGIRARLKRDVERGRIPAADAEAASARLSTAADIESLASMQDADAVIEAVVEDLGVKTRVFRKLGRSAWKRSRQQHGFALSERRRRPSPERVIGPTFNPGLEAGRDRPTASTTDESLADALSICALGASGR
jgi:3-hydroxybutyryl-CoA dehydrogenase